MHDGSGIFFRIGMPVLCPGIGRCNFHFAADDTLIEPKYRIMRDQILTEVAMAKMFATEAAQREEREGAGSDEGKTGQLGGVHGGRCVLGSCTGLQCIAL